MVIQVSRPNLTNDELEKRLSEIRRLAGIIVKDTYEKESIKKVHKQ